MGKCSVILMLLVVVSIVKTAVIHDKKTYGNNERSIQESRKLYILYYLYIVFFFRG
jgi:hypothetical protein